MNATATLSANFAAMGKPVVDHTKSPIMVVDDSVVSQLLAGGLILHGTARPVVYAKDGTEALSILELVRPCVVVTDIQMPLMDGFELVEAIRADYPQIPVILMTAYGSERVALQALKAGAASYVPKDCLITDLVDTLRQILVVVDGNQRRRQILACQSARTGSYELGNDPGLFPALIALVQEELLAFGIGDETARMRVAIAFQEALSNALYHGNLECSSELRQHNERDFEQLADSRMALQPYRSRRIHLETRIDRRQIQIDIRDEGPGFDLAILEKPCNPEDLVRVGGRGLILIRTFLDEVIHNETGNQITLIKRKS